MEKLIAGAAKLGLQLGRREADLFQTYYRELTDWNEKMNLTSITDYDAVQINHFLDALTVVLVWRPSAGEKRPRVIDVGTGPGIPGVPLKIVFPEIQLVLLDATSKKTDFLQHLKQVLGLSDIEIVVGRAEDVARLSPYRESFDVVLSRALAELATLAELTLPFCSIGGSVIAYKKGDIQSELEQAVRAISVLGGKVTEVKAVNLPEFPDQRYLISLTKVATTPNKYPRRSGMPAKRPLL
jgi:16S rRNA (guanine527-N7)-methyltransferase